MLMAMMWSIPCVPSVMITQNIVTLQFQRALVYGSMVRGAVTAEEIERFCVRSKLVLTLDNCTPEHIARTLKRWYTTGDKNDVFHFLSEKYDNAKLVAAAMSIDEMRFYMTTERVQRCLDMLPFFDVHFKADNYVVNNFPVLDKIDNVDLYVVVKGDKPIRRIEGVNYVEVSHCQYHISDYRYQDELLWKDWPLSMVETVNNYSKHLIARYESLNSHVYNMFEEGFVKDWLSMLQASIPYPSDCGKINYRVEKMKNVIFIFFISDKVKTVRTIEIIYRSDLNCT